MPYGPIRSPNQDDLEKGMVKLDDIYPQVSILTLPTPTFPLSQRAGPNFRGVDIAIPKNRFPTSEKRVPSQKTVPPQHQRRADGKVLPGQYVNVSLAIRNAKPLPTTPKRHWIRFQLWYNTYRKLFTLVFFLNMIGVWLAALDKWEYPQRYAGALALGNIQLAILMRNELFGRCLYLLVNTFFAKWPPLWFRLGCTSLLQHLGGIHSGCAVSGSVWLVFRMIVIFHDLKNNHPAVVTMGVFTTIALLVSMLSALPWMRNRHHDVFERCHRFSGWIGLLFTWLLVVVGDSYDTTTHSWNTGNVVRQQDFWFALFMTIYIAAPWFTIREVKVDVEIPSAKVVILRFSRGMQQGLLTRISRGPVLEYHAFGIVSEGTQSRFHYLICGVQGDFTKELVTDPPKTIWTRELKFAGVSNTSTLYKRGIRVCTGTGLGAALSTCLQSPDWYLVWIGSDQEKTFGRTISRLIHTKLGPHRATLWDSKKRGAVTLHPFIFEALHMVFGPGKRPDVMQLIKEVYTSWQAEVVFITSNLQGNQEMMEGCKEAGIPAFGTLWDF